jgi:acetyltransferase
MKEKGREIFPVNPNRKRIMDLDCFSSISDVPRPVDLALIVTPARTVPGLIEECGRVGVSGAMIYSEGFKEAGAEEKLGAWFAEDEADQDFGPSSLGFMRPHLGLNATPLAEARQGNNPYPRGPSQGSTRLGHRHANGFSMAPLWINVRH